MVELIAVLLPRLGQLGAKVFTQRVGHAFDQPRWHEHAAQHTPPLALQMMDEFMPNVIGIPCVRANDGAKGSNGDSRPSAQAELVCACWGGAEPHQRLTLNGPNMVANEQERLVIERSGLRELVSGSTQTDLLAQYMPLTVGAITRTGLTMNQAASGTPTSSKKAMRRANFMVRAGDAE